MDNFEENIDNVDCNCFTGEWLVEWENRKKLLRSMKRWKNEIKRMELLFPRKCVSCDTNISDDEMELCERCQNLNSM